MSFKEYFEEYMSSMKSKIGDFLNLIESKPFKVLIIIGEGEYRIVERESQHVDLEDYCGTILYCEEKALIISEHGNHKMMDEERVKDLESKFKHLND